jgi:hypothetical protein
MNDELVEKVAEDLWHRFAPSHSMTWEFEANKAEYRAAAEANIALVGRACADVADGYAVNASGLVEKTTARYIRAAILTLTQETAP